MMPPQCCVGVKWRERVRRTRVSSRDIPRPDVRSTAKKRSGTMMRAAVALADEQRFVFNDGFLWVDKPAATLES